MKTFSKLTRFAAVLSMAAIGTAALAQSTGTSNSNLASRSSWLPYTTDGYIGLDLGRSQFQNSCVGGFACDQSDQAARLYLGGYFSPHFGAEVGFVDYGDMRRAGGETRAQGLNLSLVGRAPLSQTLGLYGKLGTTYGRTRVSAAPGSGITTGSESGWAPSYALGISWHFAPNWSTALEWNRQKFDYPGNNNEWVRSTNIGVRYHF